MSFFKNDRLFPSENGEIIEEKIPESIAQALRREYGEFHSAVKVIGRMTGAHPRAIRNWYEDRNAPNFKHLVLLAQHTDIIIEAFLALAGRHDIWKIYQAHYWGRNLPLPSPKPAYIGEVYGDKSVTINVAIDFGAVGSLNQRQLWFIGQLQQKRRPKVEEIAQTWNVTLRTAKRDAATLVDRELIHFIGAKKTGFYALC